MTYKNIKQGEKNGSDKWFQYLGYRDLYYLRFKVITKARACTATLPFGSPHK